ncbi:hypothetical protein J7434_21055, partial [Xanthomonas phaseoli pv. dieffenbachiae]|uniref:hypothetical protein n=1 Tax=Xanthomonas phaseoli TaxID=1985254 RepID=UPI001ADB4B0B
HHACHEVGDGRLAPLLATAKSGGLPHHRSRCNADRRVISQLGKVWIILSVNASPPSQDFGARVLHLDLE